MVGDLHFDTHLVDTYHRRFGQEGSDPGKLLLQVPAGLTGFQIDWRLPQCNRDSSPGRLLVDQQEALEAYLLLNLWYYGVPDDLDIIILPF